MREQFNCKLPSFVKGQIVRLAERLELTQSEVVMLAIDRLLCSIEPPAGYSPASLAAELKKLTSP